MQEKKRIYSDRQSHIKELISIGIDYTSAIEIIVKEITEEENMYIK